jgi:hypothetical protein
MAPGAMKRVISLMSRAFIKETDDLTEDLSDRFAAPQLGDIT